MKRFFSLFLLVASALWAGPVINSYRFEAFDLVTGPGWTYAWKPGINTFVTGTTPAADTNTVQNIGDALTGAEVISQATSGKRPVYDAADPAFNGQPTLEGNRTNAVAMQWAPPSPIARPYTILMVGQQPTPFSGYQTLFSGVGETTLYVWQSWEPSTVSETINLDGTVRAANALDTNPNVWHFVVDDTATDHRIGKNGLSTIPPSFTGPDFAGFSLWRYPTGDTLFSGGKLAFWAVKSGNIPKDDPTLWLKILGAVERDFGIPTARTMIICDGDSRTDGYGYLSPRIEAQLWPHVLQNTFSDAVATVEIGVIGRRADTQLADAPTRLAPAFAESRATKKIVIWMNAGYNDAANGANAAVTYQRICDYVRYVHGLPGSPMVLLGTAPQGTGDAAYESVVVAVNALIVANAGDGAGGGDSIADGVLDIANDADTTSANPFAWINDTTAHHPENFSADQIHLSDDGNAIWAGALETKLATAPFNVN